MRLSYAGRDIAGLLVTERQAIFYPCDPNLNLHSTAHDPSPERGFHTGIVHTTVEELPEGEAAGAIWLDHQAVFDLPISGLKHAIPIAGVSLMVDPDGLLRYPEAGFDDGRMRLHIPHDAKRKFVDIAAWLAPPHAWYTLGQFASGRIGVIVDLQETPWMFLAAG
jgi:hypothetical protein